MTKTEQNFLSYIKPYTDKKNNIIIPQLNLQAIFKTNNIKSFNKIKSKSIDFAIVDQNYNYKLFIELDDYTHNQAKRIIRDNFINDLFKQYNLKLKRVKVKNEYNINELSEILKEIE